VGNFGHAHGLDLTLSNREEAGVQYKAGKAQKAGNQPPKVDWLNQVDDEWNRIMYKSTLDWKQKDYPDEIATLLVDASERLAAKGKWLSLLKFGEEWNM